MSETESYAQRALMPDKWYLNPKTRRYVKVGGALHKRLLKEGNTVQLDGTSELNVEMVNFSGELIDENQEELKQAIDNDDLDGMLRRLLIAKLCPQKKKKAKKKAKKRKKIKVITPPSSSDESSESSDSD